MYFFFFLTWHCKTDYFKYKLCLVYNCKEINVFMLLWSMRSPSECILFFLKGGTAKILALMAQELTASSATFSAIIYSPTFLSVCARVYCPFMLLPLFWFGQMMRWVFVWFNIPLLHSWISQDSFSIIRDTWNFWWGNPPSTTQFGVIPVGNQSPTWHVDGKRMEFFFGHLRGRFWWATLRIWVCSAVLFLFF